MSYFTYPQVICRKCGTSTRKHRDSCPVCGSDLTAWKEVPLHGHGSADGEAHLPDLSDRAAVIRTRASKKGICNYCMNSYPVEEISDMEDGTKICDTCKDVMEKKRSRAAEE